MRFGEILKGRSGIYRITYHGLPYVGSAKNLDDRCRRHLAALRDNRHHSQYLQRAYNRHREVEAFYFEVLEFVPDLKDLITREQHWINAIDSVSPSGYNMSPTAGNILGFKHSEASKEKLRQQKIGGKLSAEHRAAIGRASLGHRLSEEAKEKCRLGNLGKKKPPFTAEHRKKLGDASRGRKHSPESIQKMREVWKPKVITDEVRAKLRFNKGRVFSAEARARMSAAGKGRKKSPEHIAAIKAAWERKRAIHRLR